MSYIFKGLGTGINGTVYAMAFDSLGNLYAGGSFTTAGSLTASNIAKWYGSSWTQVLKGITGTSVNALVFDSTTSTLYVGGSFTQVATITASTNVSNIVRFKNNDWGTLQAGIAGGGIQAMACDSAGNLYVGGFGITTAGSTSVSNIAKWNGSSWSAMGTGISIGGIQALACDSAGNLYIGGTFRQAGGLSANRIVKYNTSGNNYSLLDSNGGMNGQVTSFAIDSNGNLYVGGSFTTAGNVTVSNIAKWNGSAWSNVGGGLDQIVNALTIDPYNNLYAAGSFITDSATLTLTLNGLAKWDGSNWSAIVTGTGISGVRALIAKSEKISYAGGTFTSAGTSSVNNIAQLVDGSTGYTTIYNNKTTDLISIFDTSTPGTQTTGIFTSCIAYSNNTDLGTIFTPYLAGTKITTGYTASNGKDLGSLFNIGPPQKFIVTGEYTTVESGGYTTIRFTGNGTIKFNVVPTYNEVVLAAGGGTPALVSGGGGGGAGGLGIGTFSINTTDTYTINIGNGGASSGGSGTDSTVSIGGTVVARAYGGGAGNTTGGSGGGGSPGAGYGNSNGAGTGILTYYGNRGGNHTYGSYSGTTTSSGGGGGGAGSRGGDAYLGRASTYDFDRKTSFPGGGGSGKSTFLGTLAAGGNGGLWPAGYIIVQYTGNGGSCDSGNGTGRFGAKGVCGFNLTF